MRFFLFLCLCVCFAGPSTARERVTTKHEPNVEIWLPPDFRGSEGPWPLIIFSHGLGGCGKQSSFLTSYLAENGYIVAAPDHKDARACKSLRSFEQQRELHDRTTEVPLREPAAWSDKTHADRRDDILFTLSSMLEDPQYKGFIDENRIGIAGHSLGGYTALGMAGGWPSWAEGRFKAVLAMSPYVGPYLAHKTIQDIDVPVFYMGGTRDMPATPIVKNKAWHQTGAPKYYLEIEGAGHSSFSQRDARFHGLISRQALAFFDRYLKENKADINPGKAKGVAEYREDIGE